MSRSLTHRGDPPDLPEPAPTGPRPGSVTPDLTCDVIVVGAGGAGLYTALCAADAGARVSLISARPLAQANSYWAQGGLAAALAPEDSPGVHLADTLAAGRGAVRESAAAQLTQAAPAIVADLAAHGVHFDADGRGEPLLGLEGGHSIRRVVHAGGAATGRHIVQILSARAAEHPGIEVLDGVPVTAVLTAVGRACGVVLRDGIRRFAPATVLATGGAAALWARTTNPLAATGGGLLLAHRAGAALADLELMQFHPTAVVGTGASAAVDGFLVTEAIRGEGAVLLDHRGERFVDELAPRDAVARAIFDLLARSGRPSVHLDMRAIDPARFPTILERLGRVGMDPTRELIPVAPAAHYMMGGIQTDLQAHSTLPGLLAVGECACNGLHGANRLASNSLTECFVFGAAAARAALAAPLLEPHAPTNSQSTSQGPPPALDPASRQALWRDAGLARTPEGLTRLSRDPHPLVGLIATAALARTESRGAHHRTDHPVTDPTWDGQHVILAGEGAQPVRESWR